MTEPAIDVRWQIAPSMASIVARVAIAVARNRPTATMIDDILDQTLEQLGAHSCGLYLADVTVRRLRLAGHRNFPQQLLDRASDVSFDANLLVSLAARTLEPQIIESPDHVPPDYALSRELLDLAGAQSLIAMPLLAAGRLVGTIAFTFRQPHRYSTEEVATLDALASILGTALSNALAHELIEAERSRLVSILTHIPHGVVYRDLRGLVVANPVADQLAGLPGDGRELRMGEQIEIDKHSWLAGRVLRPDGTPLPIEEWPDYRAQRGETISGVEVLFERLDGKRTPLLVSAAPVRDKPSGQVIGVVSAFDDISAQHELEQLRRELAAIVAHDLRNPIAAILLGLQALIGQAEGRDQVTVPTRMLERVLGAATRLGAIVNDLLDTSRIEIGRLMLDRKAIDVAPFLASLVEQMRPTLSRHPIRVEADGEVGTVSADRARLEQILWNLIENAAKYSPDGTPIALKASPSGAGVAIAVIDEGPGIASADLPHLFNRFYQAKRARELGRGLGLGLYITKGLVEAHGGRISVRSTVGKGSTFEVWLPRPRR